MLYTIELIRFIPGRVGVLRQISDDLRDARHLSDTFAAGAVIAGLPYRTATNIKEARSRACSR
jgi:hypothetical protein